jgi:3alpha(or 20beta)-hydroxysteroid dehydrogenase
MSRLKGKRTLITGGANGMGAETARRFVDEGAKVILGDVEVEPLARVCRKLGDAAQGIQLDVGSEADWNAAAKHILSVWGGLDVLVNNAGLFQATGMADTALADFQQIVRVNQTGTFLGMKAMAPLMACSGGGAIVNISSGAGLRGGPSSFAYSATKWAVRGMTKCAALELAASNIRVNSVHPGAIETRMIMGHDAAVKQLVSSRTPLGRMGEPREVADLTVFLASDESSYITGAEVAVDGGFTI